MNDDEVRADAKAMHDQLARDQRTAQALPPLHGLLAGEEYGVCSSCGDVAPAYKLIEGARVYICGKCAVREMDEWEKEHSS